MTCTERVRCGLKLYLFRCFFLKSCKMKYYTNFINLAWQQNLVRQIKWKMNPGVSSISTILLRFIKINLILKLFIEILQVSIYWFR